MKTRNSKTMRPYPFKDRRLEARRTLSFERLERRLVFDIDYFWVGAGADDEWADTSNWQLSGGGAPTEPTDSSDETYFDTGPDASGNTDVSISGDANNRYAAGSVDVHGSGTAQFFLAGNRLDVGPDPGSSEYAFRVQAGSDDKVDAEPTAVITDGYARTGLLDVDGIIVGGNSQAYLLVSGATVRSTTVSVGSADAPYSKPGTMTVNAGADFQTTRDIDIANGVVNVDGNSIFGGANIRIGEREFPNESDDELSQLLVASGSRVASDGVVQIGGIPGVVNGYGLTHLYGGAAALDSGKATSVGVGNRGTGEFDIDAGSVARTAGFIVGSGVESEGTATVAGIWSSRAHNVATENQFITVNPDFSLQIPPGVNYLASAIGSNGDGS